MAARIPRKPKARVGWTLGQRVQIFGERKLLDLSIGEAERLRDDLDRALAAMRKIPHADDRAPGFLRSAAWTATVRRT